MPTTVPGTTFSQKAPAVGDKFSQEDSTHLTLSLTVDAKGDGHPKSTQSEQTTTTTTDIEIQSVTGTTVDKVKVSYVDAAGTSVTDGKSSPTPNTLKGKTYVVSAKAGGGVEVRDEKGRFVPAVEATPVEKDFGWVGKPNPTNIPSHPITTGESVPELAAAMKAQLESKKGVTVSSATATTKSLAADEGVFALKVDVSQTTESGMRVDMSLAGDAHVAVKDGTIRNYSMTGPVKVSTASGTAKYDGTGTATLTRTRTPK